ncbi:MULTISPECIES: hypothetical protein [unclassified Microcoleus]|uniref:hypothetical protein n=1 Tax=unclassified Microcoleus TaxID=2642155 RepID=UPI002FD3D9DD
MKSTFYWSNWKFTVESSCYYDDSPGNVFYLEAVVMPELELVAKSQLKGWNRSLAEQAAKSMVVCENKIDENYYLKTLFS